MKSQLHLYSPFFYKTSTDSVKVAKIDAIQAEYSAFETLHETDGLIETARELTLLHVVSLMCQSV